MYINNVPEKVNWTVYRGDTAGFTIYVNDDNGAPINITTWTWTANLSNSTHSSSAALGITSASSSISVRIDDWESLEVENTFDVRAVKDDDSIWTVIRGLIAVEDNV